MERVNDLRRELMEMLTFPRLKALEVLDLETCPHGGVFHMHDNGCQTCLAMYECSWIKSHEPFVAVAGQSLPELTQTLHRAVDYMASQNHRKKSTSPFCVCETCRWIEKANRLIRQAEGRSQVVSD